MLVKYYKDVRQDDVTHEGAAGVKIRWLLADRDGAPHFAMREFELAPGGHTPYHAHEWEHEIFVLEGEGAVAGEDGEITLTAGAFALVPAGEKHNFKNAGAGPFRFLCLVPRGAK
jgi:quercetin dioxygenase-like cupin family protein